MRGRRRTRSKGTWFPTIGSATGGEGSTQEAAGTQFSINVDPAGGITTLFHPLTFDEPRILDGTSAATETLSNVLGSEYVVQRIVGKCLASRFSTIPAPGTDDENPAVLFCAGIAVARANEASVGGGIDTPIGSATQPELTENYSPLEAANIRQPWMWRRTWILGLQGNQNFNASVVSSNVILNTYPCSTPLYGSVMDGPHFDIKSKRRVGQENRLWLFISVAPFPLDEVPESGGAVGVEGYFDYRIFGSLRKARNRSAF